MTEFLSVDEIIDAIKNMKVLELNSLVKALEEEFGVSAAAMAVASPSGGAAGGGEVEKSEFDVVLAEVGENKMAVIKAVKELAGVTLKEAKALVDGAPSTIKAKVPDAEAKDIKAKLEQANAKVELK